MCCKKTISCKIFKGLFVFTALILALAVICLKHSQLAVVINISHFFEAMLPVLAAGALLKYIIGCKSFCCCKDTEEKDTCCHSVKEEEKK